MKEQNKLIAEFMGYAITDGNGNHKEPENYKYDTSWDWLIPVIKKIDSYANEEMSFSDFDDYRNNWKMIDRPSKYHIKDVFNQVVQFINWYNQQNQAQ